MAKNASDGWAPFAKAVLVPLAVALLLYLAVFHAIIPVYRRYRNHIARYSAYAPLDSSLARRTTSLFDPFLEPSRSFLSRVREQARTILWRWAVPGLRGVDLSTIGTGGGGGHRLSGDDDDDLQSVGAEEMDAGLFDEPHNHANTFDEHGSMRRLSRELEEGFRDDSESEDELAAGVTVGRSRSRSGRAADTV